MQDTVIDSKYQIVRLLGRGGMGAVYEARHKGTGRRVALKMIVPEALLTGDDIIPRFQREARASGAIDSQHVVQVLDTGVDPQTKSPYLVMEHLTGGDLQQLIQRVGPVAPDTVLRIMAQACLGLARAHQEGIVHRDIKPANLYVARREVSELVTKILDFGIAKVRVDPLSASGPLGITTTGSILGSPLYMSPEQLVGSTDLDGRSDIFALGVTMYEALCGVTPNHECETIGALVLAIGNGKGKPLGQRAPWVSRDVTMIVEKACALERSARFQSAEEMNAAIMLLLPQGASLNESMLLGASTSIGPGNTAPMADARRPPVEPAPSAPPSPAVAATAHAFTGTTPGTPARRSTWLFALPIALLLLGGVSFGLYRSRVALVPTPTPAGSSVPTEVAPPATSASTPIAADSVTTNVDAAPVADSGAKPASTASSRPTVQTPSARPRNLPPPPAPPRPNCNPNYTYENGVKRFKEECL